MKRWWHPRSVRVRLTLWYAGALTVVLVLYAGGVFVFLRHSLSAELDRRLHEDFEVAEQMLEAGVDGVGIHLQLDARRANPALLETNAIAGFARAVHQAVGDRASVQVVGGLSIEQARDLAREGLRAFVISGNLGVADANSRYDLPPAEIQRHVADFIAAIR